jgi:hypothetical protein
MIRFLQYAFIAIVVTTVGFSLYQWNASRAALKLNTNQNLNTNGLVGHWTLDGVDTVWSSSTAGTTLDKSGNSNTGTLTNMNRATTPTLGRLGQAMNFFGGSNSIKITQSASINISNTVSVSAWVYPTSNSSWQWIVSKRGSCSTVNYQFYTESGVLKFISTSTVYSSGKTLTLNKWQYVAATYDDSANTLKFYIDGVLVNTNTSATDALTGNTNDLWIGDNGCTSAFNGTIDDVRIYSRILPAEEIADLYRMSGVKENTSALQPQGIGNLDSGLTGYWKLDSDAADSSGNGNNGTLVNSPTWTTGQIGGGIGLDRVSSQYVNLNNPSTYDLTSTGSVTVSAWVKTGASIVNAHCGIVKRGALWTLETNDQYLLTASNNRFEFSLGNGTTAIEVNTPNIMVPDTWYFVTGVADANNVSIYLNGNLSNTQTRLSGSPPAPALMLIGSWATSGGYWLGTIDEVRIYNRALSADEISRLYRLTTPTEVDTSLRGYWSLDGNATNWTSSTTGTTADLSSYNNTGTLTNMNRATSPAIGKLGQSMDFVGASAQKIDFGSPAALDDLEAQGGGGMTISTWINPRTMGGGGYDQGTIINKDNIDTVANGAWSLLIADSSFKYITFRKSFGTTGLRATSANNAIILNTWQHVVVTWDGTAPTSSVKMYVNGSSVSVGGTNGVGTKISDAANPICINDCVGNRRFDGKIDEVRVYNRVLSAAEITDLYQTGKKLINTTQDINANGLIAHWTFDGKDTPWSSSSAGTTLDTSGNGHTGTLTNMNRATTPTIGKLGQALSFDGVNDYVNVPYNASFDIDNTQSLSVSMWFKATSFPGAGVYSKLFGRNNIGNTGYQCFIYQSEQRVTCYVRDTVGHSDTFTANINLNEWYHLVYVIDGTGNGTGTIYLDNVATVNSNLNDTNPFGGGGSFRLGYSDIGTAGYFTGSLDDVRIYNRVLSSTEISAIYNSGR